MHDSDLSPTERLYLEDAYLGATESKVIAIDADNSRVALDRTVFYATGGGQPHDTGWLGDARVVDVRADGQVIWHTVDSLSLSPGQVVQGRLEWERRYALMRTHTALHILCGVIWNDHGAAVTGGNMEPLAARMDFEFGAMPEGFAEAVEQRVNEEIALARPIVVSFMDRSAAQIDESLIRTKSNLVPEHVERVRIVDIVGLDKQADGGTHVRSTGEVGRVRVVKTESKGKGNKRIRIRLDEGELAGPDSRVT